MCTDGKPQLPLIPRLATNWLSYGQISVSVFIVISGYCLMLPVVSRPERRRGGLWAFFLRRARRIFPPYYAALAICVAGILTGALRGPGTSIGTKSLVLHLLLVHNLDPTSAHMIDTPMWSVATEWQIYFFFPFVLLPVWRRFGKVALCVTGLTLAMLLHLVSGNAIDESVHPWYLALFAGGAAAAAIDKPLDSGGWFVQRAGWLGVAAVALLPVAYLAKPALGRHLYFITDCLEGVAAVMLILYCRRCRDAGVRSTVLLILESRAAVWLGFISYSLYLCHFPVLQGFYRQMGAAGLSPVSTLIAMIFAGTALAILATVPFHLIFERPFLASRRRRFDPVGITA